MEQELREFGLSENEIAIYIALLKTGTTTANRLAELTGIKRSTTYDNLQLLMNKGLASKAEKGKVSYFTAAEPKKLVNLLEEKKQQVEKIVPQLKALQKVAEEKIGVTYYEGKKGVFTVLNDVFAEKTDELLFYGSRKMALISQKHYPVSFVHKRAEMNIPLRAVLAEEDRGDPVYTDKKIGKLSKLRFAKGLNQIKANVFIYRDKVALMTSVDNPAGIIIKNKEVLFQQKQIFDLLWEGAKE